jgi:hypothetical protein
MNRKQKRYPTAPSLGEIARLGKEMTDANALPSSAALPAGSAVVSVRIVVHPSPT